MNISGTVLVAVVRIVVDWLTIAAPTTGVGTCVLLIFYCTNSAVCAVPLFPHPMFVLSADAWSLFWCILNRVLVKVASLIVYSVCDEYLECLTQRLGTILDSVLWHGLLNRPPLLCKR